MFNGRHRVPGMIKRMPLVSPASHRWYWMMKVSSEHRPMKANALEEADRRTPLAFRRMTNAPTGRNDMYGCQVLYTNLSGCESSKAKYQSMITAETPMPPFATRGHWGVSVNRSSRTLITAMAANIPTYGIQRSRLTRKAHSRADHRISQRCSKNLKSVSSNHG